MSRLLPIAGLTAALGLAGCAGTWDTVTSRTFRDKPFGTMKRLYVPEDPVLVLTADPPRSGNERAAAMQRLKEPAKDNRSREAQDATIDVLARAATADLSPVLRLSAVEALGRYEDPRAAGILIAAYGQAHGRPQGTKPPVPDVVQAGAVRAADRMLITDRMTLAGPTGFPNDTVAAIRCRVLESLGRTNRPEAVHFLAHVATAGGTADAPEGAEDRDVKLAAVRGLAKCRQPEAVVALAQVMTKEEGKDGAIVGRAHDGLVRLTGKRLPAEPARWNEVVQAGNIQIAPEPTWVEQAVGWIVP